MSAIEVITSKQKTIKRIDPKTKKETMLTVDFWNPTIANLTLMALGSSAPEILLAVMETVSTLGAEPGELGPSTIVGSAAFNLLMISAICIVAPKEVKRVSDIGVFLMTAFFSVFAYVWLLIVVQIWTPDEVTIAEGSITLACFPLLAILAYFQDNNWFKKKKKPQGKGAAESEKEEELPERRNFRVLSIHYTGGDINLHADRSQVSHMVRHIREGGYRGDIAPEEEERIAEEIARQHAHEFWGKAPRLAYRVNAVRGLAGKKRFGGGGFRGTQMKSVAVVPVNEGETSVSVQGGCVVSFKVPTYAALESDQVVVITITRDGALEESVSVNYETFDGTATAGQDYVKTAGTLRFDPGEQTKTVSVPIIDDNECEPDETFELQLLEPNGCKIGRYPTCVITIIDDDGECDGTMWARVY